MQNVSEHAFLLKSNILPANFYTQTAGSIGNEKNAYFIQYYVFIRILFSCSFRCRKEYIKVCELPACQYDCYRDAKGVPIRPVNYTS